MKKKSRVVFVLVALTRIQDMKWWHFISLFTEDFRWRHATADFEPSATINTHPKRPSRWQNGHRHTWRPLSLAAALSLEVVPSRCLDSLPAAAASADSSVGMQGVRACVLVNVHTCVSRYVTVRRTHVPACNFAIPETRASAGGCGSAERFASQLFLWNGGSFGCLSVGAVFAESLFLLVGLFHQTPNTAGNLSLTPTRTMTWAKLN